MDSVFFDQETWMSDAACAHHPQKDLWFSDKPEDLEEARTICNTCYVKTECLEYALTEDIQEGVWGALLPIERFRWSKAFLTLRRDGIT